MKKERRSRWIINVLLYLVGRKEMADLHTASAFPRIAQATTLRSILEYAKDSAFGKEHHFDEILGAKNDKQMLLIFRKRVRPSEFEDYRPYVDRMLAGEQNVLFKGKPLLYATTSGSTGKPKYVPISKTYLSNVYGRMTRLWLYNCSRHRKRLFSGSTFPIVGKEVEEYAADGTIIGSVSGFTQRNAPKYIRNLYPVPRIVYDIDDYAARNYVMMRFALEHNVTFWVAPNPSTILEMQNNVDKYLDDFIDDIGNGTISDRFPVPDKIRRELAPYLKPNPKRAFQLRALDCQYERVLPCHFWPDLKILCSWKCGNTQIYLKKMAGFLGPDTLHMELGYFATECRAGLVLDRSNESVLMPHMHFYEFRREKDLGNPDAPFYQLHELKVGERYCPYVTTYSGLYRYNMNDIVQVSSPFLATPRVHMVQKVNGIVSITGEKLYEEQFVRAVDMAQTSTGIKLSYYTGYVNLVESRYDWYFEFSDRFTSDKKMNEFAKVVDDNLKSLNIEYKSKRESFRLKDPAVYKLAPNAFVQFKEFILSRTHRDASRFKPNVLAQNEENHAVIHNLREED